MMKAITPLIKNILITWFIVLIASLILVMALNFIVDDAAIERWENQQEISI